MRNWLEQRLEGQVYWVEVKQGRIPRITLASAPIEVGQSLKAQLYDRVPTVILASATLSGAGDASGFKLTQDRLGLDESQTKQLGSPFDFKKQAELHLFRAMPDPSADPARYEEAVLKKIPEYVDRTKGRAFVHHFRKTGLQHARRGEDINREVAADARVGESVLMTSYVKETDEELRAKSNRTYQRIVASLSPEVAERYGYCEPGKNTLEEKLNAAVAAGDWHLVTRLSSELARSEQSAAG